MKITLKYLAYLLMCLAVVLFVVFIMNVSNSQKTDKLATHVVSIPLIFIAGYALYRYSQQSSDPGAEKAISKSGLIVSLIFMVGVIILLWFIL